MKKKLVGMLMATVMTMALTVGCGSGSSQTDSGSAGETESADASGSADSADAASGEQYTVAMITYSLAEEFGVDVLTGAQEAADELGINLVYQDPAGDMQKDVSIMEDLNKQGEDEICIAPEDAKAVIPYNDEVRGGGVGGGGGLRRRGFRRPGPVGRAGRHAKRQASRSGVRICSAETRYRLP